MLNNKYTIMGKLLLIKQITTANTNTINIASSSNFIRGKILLVGNGYSGDSSEIYDMSPFYEGMIVFFYEKAAQSIMLNNERYLIVETTNIIAIDKEEK